MKLSASELATLDFYQWEYLGRGYYLSNTPVNIEPPYIPFVRPTNSSNITIDDGKAPSLASQLVSFFNTSEKEEPKKELTIEPNYLEVDEVPELLGLSLSFSDNYKILQSVVTQFLNILSFTYHPISFEIVAVFEKIRVQIVSSKQDFPTVESQLKAYFPDVMITSIDPMEYCFDGYSAVAITDFGLNEEYMRPIASSNNYDFDPLVPIIATLEQLQEGETALVQTIFKGVSAPWSRDITYAVSDGRGGSFFMDSPEMLNCAKEKVSQPLFSVVKRIAVQGNNKNRSKYLATTIAKHISTVTSSSYNKLIPLSNEGYNYDFHLYNVLHRTSNRLGCILNSTELATIAHYPNRSVVSEFLHTTLRKTRAAHKEYQNLKYVLGTNTHRGVTNNITISDEHKVRHTHVIGSTGVGKSTLLITMMVDDMNHGNGLFLFDPHGDIVDDVMARVPSHRINDVIIIDPSDTDFPIGFNLLHAPTDVEKIVLSSDIVETFKRYATSWGDNMSAVLAQAVNTFLESSKAGTLIELKRFLLEDEYRKQFLKTITDPSLHYYWNNEYGFVKKRIAPLLTRLDTFLRPKIIRYMLAQKNGIDLKECIEEKKIVLFKLPQGLIGEENSHLLGSLLLSKINQVTLGRQSLSKEKRIPFYTYIDECHHYLSNSITSILSGARKYGLGLVLTHQDLTQINDPKILNSILSNPMVRICFRLGDNDAKKLSDGFAHFDAQDLQSLDIGQAIMRVGSSAHDWNISTEQLRAIDSQEIEHKRTNIVNRTREQYGSPREEIEELLRQLLPKLTVKELDEQKPDEPILLDIKKIDRLASGEDENIIESIPKTLEPLEEQKDVYLKQIKKQEIIKKHQEIQQYIQAIARQRGFKVEIEKQIKNNKRIDLVLTRDKLTIAIEVAVTNSIAYEVANIRKCLSSNITKVLVVSESKTHLNNIKKEMTKALSKATSNVLFIQPEEIGEYLDTFNEKPTKEQRIKGYRVRTDFSSQDASSTSKAGEITQMIINAMRKKK
ncbi:MAG: type IV secretion system DNA-binding domain-containing protein [Flavobacteriaceae bacterium]